MAAFVERFPDSKIIWAIPVETTPEGIRVHRPGEPPGEEVGDEKKSFIGRLRPGRKQRVFITTQGHCAVCQRAFMAGTEENLRLSGWRVSGDVGLCPDCQADGWQLPDGARLPFRRGRQLTS
jgi:hypothetical protein